VSGEMLDSLGPINVTASSFGLGWTDPEMEARAAYNAANGRRFLGLDRTTIMRVIGKFIRKRRRR
jgi:hypothetical protein